MALQGPAKNQGHFQDIAVGIRFAADILQDQLALAMEPACGTEGIKQGLRLSAGKEHLLHDAQHFLSGQTTTFLGAAGLRHTDMLHRV